MTLLTAVVAALAVALLLVLRLGPALRRLLRVYWITRTIPGPRIYPIIGSLYAVRKPMEDPLGEGLDFFARYGPTVRIYAGTYCAIAVTDPDDVQVVFTHPHLQNKVSLAYDTIIPMMGSGLLNLNGEVYRRHRKAITASLHLQILQDFFPTFRSNADRLARLLRSKADSGEVFDVMPIVGDCANLNVCETVLSADVTGMEEARKDYIHNCTKSSELMLWRMIRPWYWNETLFKLFCPRFEEYRRVASAMSHYVAQVLELKLRQAKKPITSKPTSNSRITFVEHFLRSEESSVLNKAELLDELKTLMFAASETSATLTSFFLLVMSIYPDIQLRVQKEVDDVLGGDESRLFQSADLSRLQYLERVLKEVLRLLSPAPVMGREVTGDVDLPSGHTLPEGAVVVLLPPLTHRLERSFDDPQRFDPDRFLPEASRNRHPYSFIPFSAGARSCVGQKYGMMFVKTMTATLMRKYTALLDPKGPKTIQDLKLNFGVTLSVVGGVNIRLLHRR